MTLRPLWGLVCIGMALSNFSPGVAALKNPRLRLCCNPHGRG